MVIDNLTRACATETPSPSLFTPVIRMVLPCTWAENCSATSAASVVWLKLERVVPATLIGVEESRFYLAGAGNEDQSCHTYTSPSSGWKQSSSVVSADGVDIRPTAANRRLPSESGKAGWTEDQSETCISSWCSVESL